MVSRAMSNEPIPPSYGGDLAMACPCAFQAPGESCQISSLCPPRVHASRASPRGACSVSTLRLAQNPDVVRDDLDGACSARAMSSPLLPLIQLILRCQTSERLIAVYGITSAGRVSTK